MANYISDNLKADDGAGKKQITPQSIYNALVKDQKNTLFARLILIGCVVLVLLLTTWPLMLMDAPFGDPGTKIVKLLLIASPILDAVFVLYLYLRGMNGISEDNYTIIVDRIERIIVDEKLVRRGRRMHMQHAMYLYHCGRIVIPLQATNTESEGDTVYVLVKKKRPNKPIMLFNDKYYELVGLSVEEI